MCKTRRMVSHTWHSSVRKLCSWSCISLERAVRNCSNVIPEPVGSRFGKTAIDSVHMWSQDTRRFEESPKHCLHGFKSYWDTSSPSRSLKSESIQESDLAKLATFVIGSNQSLHQRHSLERSLFWPRPWGINAWGQAKTATDPEDVGWTLAWNYEPESKPNSTDVSYDHMPSNVNETCFTAEFQKRLPVVWYLEKLCHNLSQFQTAILSLYSKTSSASELWRFKRRLSESHRKPKSLRSILVTSKSDVNLVAYRKDSVSLD